MGELGLLSEYSIVENPSEKLWNSFLNMFPEGNFEQCYEYGEIAKMAFPKTVPVRLAIARGGELAGIVQGNYSRYFGFGMELEVMRGPVIAERNEAGLQLAENLLEALEDYGKKNRVIHARIVVPETWGLEGVFHKLGYVLEGKLNEYAVNLEGGVEKVWRSIDHNKRRNVKRALNEGVEVIRSHDHDDLVAFYSMLKAAQDRAGFSSYPLSWFEAVWDKYKPEELSNVFLARWNGKSVSGVFTVVHEKTVFALAAGSLSEGWKVRPNDIMHWKAMEWASQNGYSKYHMGLVSEPPPVEGSPAWGIWRWKREWRGKLGSFQIFRKTFLPRYQLVSRAKRIAERGYTFFKKLR